VVFLLEAMVVEGLKPDHALYWLQQDHAQQARGMKGAAASRPVNRLFLGAARAAEGTAV